VSSIPEVVQKSSNAWKSKEGVIDHFGVVDGVATEPELGYNAVKLGVECDEIWKIHHVEADPVAPGLWQKIASSCLNRAAIAAHHLAGSSTWIYCCRSEESR
jgi:hypothetical protein